MIYIGIDVAKYKHDCFITNSEGEVLFNAFTIPNNADGFHDLFQKISSLTNDFSNVKVGLEATGDRKSTRLNSSHSSQSRMPSSA